MISLTALVATQRTTAAKTTRELREELKEQIEKLIDLRSEFNRKLSEFQTEYEREVFGGLTNTKKSIYLESAEYLARRLPRITSAEWMVLGNEHHMDSNFAKAAQLFTLAVRAAQTSSAVAKIAALRALAGAQMFVSSSGAKEGRQTFQQAVNLIADRKDPYSIYTNAFTHRFWAGTEWQLGHFGEAHEQLRKAMNAARNMPD